jgi:hypothetical protein
MEIEVSSESHILTRPDPNLDIQQLNEPAVAGVALSATSAETGVVDEAPSNSLKEIPLSASPLVDYIPRPRRRRASPRHANGGGPSSEVAAVNHATNSDEAATEDRQGESNVYWGTEYADKEEVALVKHIGLIWSTVQFKTRNIRKNREERAPFRVDLARELYGFKARLAGSGRSGKWSAFLRDIDIPRATADRYVQRWEHSLTQVSENRLDEPISPPTTEEVTRMVNRIKPKLLRLLTTADAVERFMGALGAALQVPRSS